MGRPWQALLLLGLLALAQAPSARGDDGVEEDYSDQERALLIVRKSVKDGVAVQGRNLTVTVSVYNAGLSTALNVELEDADLPDSFQLLDGSLSAKFERIPIASSVTHEYVLVPTSAKGGLVLPAASVRYQAELDNEDYQVGRSTTLPVFVLTPAEQIEQYLLKTGTYATLGLCKTAADWRNVVIVTVLVVGLLGGNWGYKRVTAQKQKWNREKHLKDFGLDSDDDGARKAARRTRRAADSDKDN